jgi:hypothetical protein
MAKKAGGKWDTEKGMVHPVRKKHLLLDIFQASNNICQYLILDAGIYY